MIHNNMNILYTVLLQVPG